MAITQILEKYVQGDDIAITVNIGPDSVGSTCTSKIENYDRVTVATFVPTEVSPTEVLLTLAGSDTASIPAGKYRWDVKVITTAGKVATVVIGIIEFLEST
jgi:hypothetical protein